MKRVILSVMLLILNTGCSKLVGNHRQIRQWYYTGYETCDAKPLPGVTLPFDIAVSTHRFDLKFGRYDAQYSHRSIILKKDGTNEDVGSSLITKMGQERAQFNGWSPDGLTAYINFIYEDPQSAMCNEAYDGSCPYAGFAVADVYSYKNGIYTNLTAIDRVSLINSGATYSTEDPTKLVFSALINNQSKPYTMNLDGTNKQPATSTGGFTYGYQLSPDGTKYTFHSNYKVFIGDSATKVETQVTTPCSFNFLPTWSPDSQYITFSCGTSYVGPDIAVADRDGNNFKIVGYRNGFDGAVPFMYAYDWHGGGSDLFTWTPDSQYVIYTRMIDNNVEIYKVSRNGGVEIRLTHGMPGAWSNFPTMSPDGNYLAFTRYSGNSRDLYMYHFNSMTETKVTAVKPHCGIRYPYWRPF